MHVITLAGSEHQKSRLRNGHKVRVKHGAGFNVIVSPDTYHLVSRSFNKNKGTTLQLSPEEIAMNKAPSPEMQRQIMGHNEHLILPNPMGALVKGSGIGDWFKNIGNQIKSGFEEKIINPVKEKIIDPAMDLYNKNVPADIRRDINTGLKFSSPAGLLASTIDRVRRGEKIQDVMRDYGEDLKHLNNTKNKIIKSSPVLTEAYKKGVPALAGIATGALGSAFGLSPVTGALVGAAGAKGADELLKAEGYGLHHCIEAGEKHHYHELKHHRKPIGGALKWSHITNFFKNAGHAVQKAMPVVKQGAKMAHNFLLNNPKLAAKVKEHGSKLAGMLAKMGVNYLTGNEKYGDQAEQMGSKLADEQIHQKLGYGLHHAIEAGEKHHYHELKHHSKPIGGALKWSHITNFFKNAGHAIQKAAPVVKQGAQMAHNFLLNNPKLAEKVKQHGSKLAGMLAKMGINYITGNEKYGDQAEQMGSKLADEQIHQKLGYGIHKKGRGTTYANKHDYILHHRENAQASLANANNMLAQQRASGQPQIVPLGSGLTSGQSPSSGNGLGTGLYAGKMRGTGPFHSYHTLKDASDAYAHANEALANMSRHIIHSQHMQRPIAKYYDSDGAPPSRGTGIHPHNSHHIHQDNHLHQRMHVKHPHDNHNLIRGRGTLIEHDTHLPQALTSQPYGANFHMQFQLPPQYQKYNDGTYTF